MTEFWRFGANYRQFLLKFDQFYNWKDSKHPKTGGMMCRDLNFNYIHQFNNLEVFWDHQSGQYFNNRDSGLIFGTF